MMIEDTEAVRPSRGWALAEVSREDLELYSVGDLNERIEQLEGEIARTRAALDKKRSSRSAADAFFSLGGN
jgi:uncharacterized small protein (DUF1192 family)